MPEQLDAYIFPDDLRQLAAAIQSYIAALKDRVPFKSRGPIVRQPASHKALAVFGGVVGGRPGSR